MNTVVHEFRVGPRLYTYEYMYEYHIMYSCSRLARHETSAVFLGN